MKFLKPNGISDYELPSNLLGTGEEFSLIHSSMWSPQVASELAGCWSCDLDPSEILRTIQDGKAETVLQSEPPDFPQDVQAWVDLRREKARYFERPLETLLCQGEDFKTIAVSSAGEKTSVRLEVEGYASAHGNQSCVDSAMALFEELFMNALIDAPREAAKHGRAGATTAMFHMGIDERRLGLACVDPHGSLDLGKLLNRMRDVYARGAGKAINLREPGGAGLGCVMMLEHSSLLTFGVQKNRATAVSCLIPRHLSNRRKAELKKSFHVLVME